MAVLKISDTLECDLRLICEEIKKREPNRKFVSPNTVIQQLLKHWKNTGEPPL